MDTQDKVDKLVQKFLPNMHRYGHLPFMEWKVFMRKLTTIAVREDAVWDMENRIQKDYHPFGEPEKVVKMYKGVGGRVHIDFYRMEIMNLYSRTVWILMDMGVLDGEKPELRILKWMIVFAGNIGRNFVKKDRDMTKRLFEGSISQILGGLDMICGEGSFAKVVGKANEIIDGFMNSGKIMPLYREGEVLYFHAGPDFVGWKSKSPDDWTNDIRLYRKETTKMAYGMWEATDKLIIIGANGKVIRVEGYIFEPKFASPQAD